MILKELLGFAGIEITPEIDVKSILDYQKATEEVINSTEGFSEATKETAKKIAEKEAAEKLATAATTQATIATNKLTLAQKAATFATGALKAVAGALVVTLATMAVIKIGEYFYDLAHAEEIAAQKAEEANNKIKELNSNFEEQSKYIKENADAYEKLSKGVDLNTNTNISLSNDDYEQFLSISNELAEIFPELKKSTDENGNAILAMGDNSRITAKSLNNLLVELENTKNFKISEELPSIFEDLKNKIEDAKEAQDDFDEKYEGLENLRDQLVSLGNIDEISLPSLKFSYSTNNENWAEQANVMESFLNESLQKFYDNLSDEEKYNINLSDIISITDSNLDDGSYDIDLSGLIGLDENNLKKVTEIIKQSISEELKNVDDEIGKEYQKNSETQKEIEYKWKDYIPSLVAGMKSKSTFKELDEGTQAVAEKIVSGLDFSISEEMSKFEDPYDYVRKYIIIPLSELNDKDREKVNNLYNQLFSFDADASKMNTEQIQAFIDNIINQIASYTNQNPIEIKAVLGIENNNELYDQSKRIRAVAASKYSEQSGLSFNDELKKLKDFESKYSINSDEEKQFWNQCLQESITTEEAMQTYINGANKFNENIENLSYGETIDKLNEFAPALEALDEVYAKFADGDKDTNINFEDLVSLNEEFANIEGIENYIKAIQDAKGNAKATQEAFDNLATAYVNQIGILDEVNEGNANLIESMLKEQGIANANELVQIGLARSKAEASIASKDLTSMTSDEINAMAEEAGVTGQARDAFELYIAQKMLNEVINTNGDIEALAGVMEALGLATDAWINYYRAKKDLDAINDPGNRKVDASGRVYYEYKSTDSTGREVTKRASQLQVDQLNNDIKQKQDAITEELNKKADALISTSYTGGNATKEAKSGSDKKDDTETIDWIERLIEKIQKERDKLSEKADSSYINIFGINQEDIDRAKELFNLQETLINQSGELVNAQEQNSEKIKNSYVNLFEDPAFKKLYEDFTGQIFDSNIEISDEYLDNMMEFANNINLGDFLAGRDATYDFKLKEPVTDNIKAPIEELSEIANKAGLSLGELYDVVFNGANYDTKQSYLEQLLIKDRQNIEVNKRALEEYNNQYKEAASKIDKSIVEKIENGSFDIETYSGDNADDIKEVMDLYDKVSEQSEKVDQVNTTYIEDKIRYHDNIIEQIDVENEKIERSNKLIEAQIDYLKESGQIISAGFYNKLIGNTDKQISFNERKIQATKNKLQDLLNDTDPDKRIEEGSLEYIELEEEIEELESNTWDLKSAQEAYRNELLQLPIKNMETIVGMYNDITTSIQNWGAEIEASGKKLDEDYYQSLIQNGTTVIDQYEKQARLIREVMNEYDKGSDNWNELYSQLQSINSEMSSMVQNLHEWNEALLEMPINSISDQVSSLEMVKEALEGVQSEYDTVLTAVNEAIEKQKEALSDENEATNDRYNDEIEALQDRLDLLQKQNEELSLQQAVEQALYELQRANTQKTERVIRDGQIVYETNKDNIINAQEQLQDALQALEEYKIQDQIDGLQDELEGINEAYQDQIDALDKIAEKWQEIKTNVEEAQNAAVADDILGDGWVDKVLSGNDEDIYNAFKDSYETNAEMIQKYEKQIETTQNIQTLLQQYIESYKEGTLSYEQAMSGIKDILSQMNEDMSSGKNLQNILDFLGSSEGVAATSDAVLQGIKESLKEASDEMVDSLEQYNENLDLIVGYMTSWDQLVDNTDKMVDLLEDVRDNLSDALDGALRNDDDDDDGGSNNSNGIIHGSGDFTWTDNDLVTGPGIGLARYSKGIENGVVGERPKDTTDKLKVFATKRLNNGEVPALLHDGEVVLNRGQQNMLLNNIETASNPFGNIIKKFDLSSIPLNNSKGDINIEIGDIKLTDVRDVDGFARAMGSQFKPLLTQEMKKINR